MSVCRHGVVGPEIDRGLPHLGHAPCAAGVLTSIRHINSLVFTSVPFCSRNAPSLEMKPMRSEVPIVSAI